MMPLQMVQLAQSKQRKRASRAHLHLVSPASAAEVTIREALPNDVEGEATCHYVTEHLPPGRELKVTRIGFGLPSGGGVLYADAVTLKSALEARRGYK